MSGYRIRLCIYSLTLTELCKPVMPRPRISVYTVFPSSSPFRKISSSTDLSLLFILKVSLNPLPIRASSYVEYFHGLRFVVSRKILVV